MTDEVTQQQAASEKAEIGKRLEQSRDELNLWLSRIGLCIVETNRLNGFNVLTPEDWPHEGEINTDKLGKVLALIHSEVSEALEEVRKGTIEGFQEELADVVIRCFDAGVGISRHLNRSFCDVLIGKMIKNTKRPYKHGKRC